MQPDYRVFKAPFLPSPMRGFDIGRSITLMRPLAGRSWVAYVLVGLSLEEER